jgi:hypothetical protein
LGLLNSDVDNILFKEGDESWGLYTDNAFIKGQVVSITEYYSSGINTKSESYVLDEEGQENTDEANRIVFWGGARIGNN